MNIPDNSRYMDKTVTDKERSRDLYTAILESQSSQHRKQIAKELLAGTTGLPTHLVPDVLQAIEKFPEFIELLKMVEPDEEPTNIL